jgi:hemoglobin-like flavoprotein
MNSEQITLVQRSFGDVRPVAGIATGLFYDRLFMLDPSLRLLFKGDLIEQGRMLMSTLSAAVGSLSKLDALAPVLRDLGARHAAYGVRSTHYETVGTALLWTLEKGLGDEFTAPVRDAWAAAYELLSGVVQMGAIEATSRESAAA